MTDPIADLLTRIRNALNAGHESVIIPHSKLKESILKILISRGFIDRYIVEEQKPQSNLRVFLRYDEAQTPVIHRLKRISKPGRRVYRPCSEIHPFLKGMGVRIYSTTKGVLTDIEARKNNVGGEVLCEVW